MKRGGEGVVVKGGGRLCFVLSTFWISSGQKKPIMSGLLLISWSFFTLLISYEYIFYTNKYIFSCLYFEGNHFSESGSNRVCFPTRVKAIIKKSGQDICCCALEIQKSVCCYLVWPRSHAFPYISLSASFAIPLPSFLPSLTVFSIWSSHLYITPIFTRWDGNWVGGLGCRIRWRSRSGQK